MLRIDLINVQAISEAHFEFQDNSITEFVGNNSNGKSIVAKVIEYLTKGDLTHSDVREAIMKDGCEQSVVLFTYGYKQLGVILKAELRDCLIMYVPDIRKEKEPNGRFLRPLGDADGTAIFLKQFGFRTYAKGDICLQLAPTFGAIPFVTTSGAINSDIVNDITVDRVADEFLTSFSTITFPTFKNRIKKLKAEQDHLMQVIENMESYDWRRYDELANRMSELYQCLAGYEYIEVKDIPIPNLDIIDVPYCQVVDIPIVTFYEYPPVVESCENELSDYIQIVNGVCPTCGKPLIE